MQDDRRRGPIPRHNDDQAHLLNRSADPNEPHELHRGSRSATRRRPTTSSTGSRRRASTRRTRESRPPGPTPVTIDPAMARSSAATSSSSSSASTSSGAASSRSSRPGTASSSSPTRTRRSKTVDVGQEPVRAVGGRRHDDPPAARRLLAARLARRRHRLDRRERLRGRRAVVRRNGVELHDVAGFNPPRGTSVCATNPGDPGCTSCAFGKNGERPAVHDERRRRTRDPTRLGLRPQPAARAREAEVRRLGAVPDPALRARLDVAEGAEPRRRVSAGGARATRGSRAATSSASTRSTRRSSRPSGGQSNWNPTADELCNLTPGTRKPGLVFYAHIGGVPHQLLQLDPTNPDSPQKDTLTEADWTLILGKDPENWDYTGIDPHMVEDYQPRTGVPVPPQRLPGRRPESARGNGPDLRPRMDDQLDDGRAPRRPRRPRVRVHLQARQAAGLQRRGDHGRPDAAGLVRLPAPEPNTGSFTPAEIPAVCNSADAHPAGLREGVPDDPRARARAPARAGQRRQRGHHLVALPDPHARTCPRTARDPLYGYRPAMNAIISGAQQDAGATSACRSG